MLPTTLNGSTGSLHPPCSVAISDAPAADTGFAADVGVGAGVAAGGVGGGTGLAAGCAAAEVALAMTKRAETIAVRIAGDDTRRAAAAPIDSGASSHRSFGCSESAAVRPSVVDR